MKKTLFFVLAIAAAVVVSCKKEQSENTVLVYNASVDGSFTKTTLNGVRDIFWNTGDKILSSVDDSYVEYTLSSGSGTTSATFTYSGAGTPDENKPAFFGYNIGTAGGFNVTDETHVTLPSAYTWSDQGIQAPMIDSDGSAGEGKFTLMGGVLKVDVENIPASANKLVFAAAGKNLSGDYELTSGTLEVTDGTNSTISVSFPAGAGSRTFFFPVPAGNYPSFSISVQKDDTVLDTKNASAANLTVERGDLVYLAAVAFKDVDEYVIWTGSHSCGTNMEWNKLTLQYVKYMTPGTIIRIVFSENTSNEGRMFIQAYNGSDWADLDNGHIDYVAASTSIDCELSSTDITRLANDGLRIDGCEITISKVALVNRKANTETVIFDDTSAKIPALCTNGNGYEGMGWNDALWASVNAGDLLRLSLSNVTSASSHLDLRHEANGWERILDTDILIGVPISSTAIVEYPITSDVLDDLRAKNGLVIIGYDLTISKAEIISRNALVPETVIWKGSHNTGEWSNDLTDLSASFLSSVNLRDGSKICIYGSGTGVMLQDQTYNNNQTLYDGTGYKYCVLDADGATALKANGIRIKGSDYTITKVTVIR